MENFQTLRIFFLTIKHETWKFKHCQTFNIDQVLQWRTFKHCLMFSSSQPPPSPHHQRYITNKSKYIINILCWGNALKRPSEIFLLLFVIQQLHCQTFWFKWCWRFSGHFPTFCLFPIKTRASSQYLCLGLQPHIRNHPTQCDSHPTHASQHSTEIIPHNTLVILRAPIFFWSLQRNIFGHYSEIFSVNTAKYFWSILHLSQVVNGLWPVYLPTENFLVDSKWVVIKKRRKP